MITNPNFEQIKDQRLRDIYHQVTYISLASESVGWDKSRHLNPRYSIAYQDDCFNRLVTLLLKLDSSLSKGGAQ